MQKEIETEAWPTTVQIHGINAAGRESGNATICNGRTTPWLQDTSAAQVYQKWNVTYRDVIIVNELNQPVVGAVVQITFGDEVLYDTDTSPSGENIVRGLTAILYGG